jgi:hypothetical protein
VCVRKKSCYILLKQEKCKNPQNGVLKKCPALPFTSTKANVQNQKLYLDPSNPNTPTWHWIEDDAALLPLIPAELCAFLRRTKEMGFAFSFLQSSQTNSFYCTFTESLPPPPPAHNPPPSNTTHKKLPHCRILSLSLSLSLCVSL